METDFSVSEKWDALIAAFDSVGFVISEGGRYEEIIYTPETESKLYNDPTKLHGQRFHEVLPRTTADEFLSLVETVLEHDEAQSHEYSLQLESGTRWFDALVAPLAETDDGRYVLWLARDITEQRRNELELRQYKTIVEESGDLIYIADEDGCFSYVNEAFADASGYDRGEILDEHATLVMDESDVEEGRELISSLLSSGETQGTFEMDLITADGVRIPCENHIVLLPFEEEFRGSAGVLRDITERKEREQQLAVLDRVLRHNLRNEMNLIIGNAQQITRTGDGDVAETAGKIASVGTGLLDLVDKERELADLISASPPKRPYELRECVTDPVERLRDRYPAADIDVTLPDNVYVVAIPQLSRAVLELGENAIQHSNRESPSLDITASVDENRVELCFADNGPGMPEKERKVLIGEKEIGPLYHGRGMGLRLVDWIVTLAGGQLAIEDNDPRGAVVRINLARTNEKRK